MLNSKLPSNQQLVPLSVLADKGPYQLTYLSILVQRKKLKAKKIGKKYYSKLIWLEEYLELHGNRNFAVNLSTTNNSKIISHTRVANRANLIESASEHLKGGIFSYFRKITRYLRGNKAIADDNLLSDSAILE
jgi:hypothetical protein